ncbi:hypothetical protein Trco_000978 [Trichoderma cornu-damae]|uniref:protein-histidine N-methyltransferase n=1 Tax=Trichoderma cornu-damae TaxID=654480 RepID=A0A9P8TZS5_9HYPO|nr:hypothetical protein Trco_000978 [Trichoderma cornu-damae]
MSFSFGFSGDDIENDGDESQTPPVVTTQASASYSAFPIPGKPQLPAAHHSLSDFLSQLPSKIAYDLLDIDADDGETQLQLPRRELWDVRVQLMAEDDEVMIGGEDRVDDGGLGKHDVKTGIYEGGFKSWESSIDLVKVLAARDELTAAQEASSLRVVELGCGTALPSLAVFTWIMQRVSRRQWQQNPCSFVLADYNPSVLRLVTLPNFVLAWALQNTHNPVLQDAFNIEGELELSPSIIQAFERFLSASGIHMSFISGAWSPEFVRCLYDLPAFSSNLLPSPTTLMVGAETIYSPFALQAFTQTVFAILHHEKHSGARAAAYVAAKRLYFGVGGSLDDFIEAARSKGAIVTELREESEGVRRGVVHCILQQQGHQ